MDSPAQRGKIGNNAAAISGSCGPVDEDQVAGMLSDRDGEDFRRHNERIAEAARQRQVLAGLFSEDPRRQYAALRQLESAEAISERLYERVREIRSDTPHLLIAEAAATLLERKPREFRSHISEQTRREVAALLDAQEERERRRLRTTAKEAAVIRVPGRSLAAWLAIAVGLGGLLGGIAVYALLPRDEVEQAAPGGVYLDKRSGTLLNVDDATDDTSQRASEGGYEPAYYCWKCKQWLPVRKPQGPGATLDGPRQALADRPLTPKTNRNPKGR